MNADDSIYLKRWVTERDADAFRQIVMRYSSMVFASARRVLGNAADAEDVAQECFQALASAQNPPAGYLGPWLHRVATNLALNKRRSESRLRAREHRYGKSRSTHVETTWNDIHGFVDEALAQLPDELRIPLVAHFLEGRSQTDVAAALGLPRQTLVNRLQRGVLEVRKHLARRGIVIGAAALAGLLASNMARADVVPKVTMAVLGKMALSGAGKHAILPAAPISVASGGVNAVVAGVAAMTIVCLAAVGYIMLRDKAPASQVQAATMPESQPIETSEPAKRDSAPFALADASSEAKPPAPKIVEKIPATVAEVLDAYADHQRRIQRISFSFFNSATWTRMLPANAGYPSNPRAETFEKGDIAYDGHRYYMLCHISGEDGGEYRLASHPHERILAFDGKQDWQWDGDGPGEVRGLGSIGKGAPLAETLEGTPSNGRYYGLWTMHDGSAAFGFFTLEGRRIDEILREVPTATLRTASDKGIDYAVVNADSAYGVFEVWFDRSHDYEIGRVFMLQDSRHFGRKGDMQRVSSGLTRKCAYNVTRFIEVDGEWVTKNYTRDFEESRPHTGWYYHKLSKNTRSAITLNPDFDSQEAFAFLRTVPEGSQWIYRNYVGERLEMTYWWEGGQLVPRPGAPVALPAKSEGNGTPFGAGSTRR